MKKKESTVARILNSLGEPIEEKDQVISTRTGDPIVLPRREQVLANFATRRMNELGFDINITTLTTMIRKITEQQFYEVMGGPANFLDFIVGEGAWSEILTAWTTFQDGDDFETGLSNQAGDNAKLETVDANVSPVHTPVRDWAKTILWTLVQVEKAAKAGNWSLIESKMKALKKNYDLGIQRTTFLGLRKFGGPGGSTLGLLNLSVPAANIDEVTIPKNISDMTTTEFKAFQKSVLGIYGRNAEYTVMPNRFLVPMNDYLGMNSQTSPEFPLKTVMEVLEEGFKKTTQDASFKILPVAYANKDKNPLKKNIYVLYHANEDSLRMNVPVPFSTTVPNSLNGFQMQLVAYSQFTGVTLMRPKTVTYFRNTA